MNPRSRRQLILLITVKLEKKCKERKYSKNNMCGEMILSQIVLVSLVKNYLCFKSKELKQTYSIKTGLKTGSLKTEDIYFLAIRVGFLKH